MSTNTAHVLNFVMVLRLCVLAVLVSVCCSLNPAHLRGFNASDIRGRLRKMPGVPSTLYGEGDVVVQFLQTVEEIERNIDNCTKGTQTNLGEGVVDQYGLGRFRPEALVAVNRANFLTRLWKYAPPEVLYSEYLLFSLVRSMVELDDDIFAAGNCYDRAKYKDYEQFCPFAHRDRNNETIIWVKDLSAQYKYLDEDSEWFYTLKEHASNLSNFGSSDGKREPLLLISFSPTFEKQKKK